MEEQEKQKILNAWRNQGKEISFGRKRIVREEGSNWVTVKERIGDYRGWYSVGEYQVSVDLNQGHKITYKHYPNEF